MIMIAGNIGRDAQATAQVTLGRVAVSVYQAFSQGHVRIISTDPDIDPAIEERMLSDQSGLIRMRHGVRRLRDICLSAWSDRDRPSCRVEARLLIKHHQRQQPAN
jgi:5-(hydroxymethyl)furfural/furfural oxidase